MKNHKLPGGIPLDIYETFEKYNYKYMTVSYIARVNKFSEKIVLEFIKKYPDIFKLSYLKSDLGADVYFIRKNCFWKIIDIWNTFCHINSLKY